MGIKLVQQCRSCEGWTPVEVRSRSDDDTRYVVMVNPWGETSENICDCKGYKYRGSCRHQIEASLAICGWSESEGPEQQTEEQRDSQTCPRCKLPTKYQMEFVDE